jgi:hypothetical protein
VILGVEDDCMADRARSSVPKGDDGDLPWFESFPDGDT